MEKPRPSPNFGKCTSTRVTRARRSTTAAGSSVGSSRSTSPCSGDGVLSLTTRRPLINVGIDEFLERRGTDAIHHVDEALSVAVPVREIAVDQTPDDVGHLGTRECRTDDFAKRCPEPWAYLALVAADLDLIPLLAVLVDAENADMPDVVVAAGVHAAGDVEIELADVVQIVEIVEAPLDGLRDRDRFRVRQRAEIAARATDDVGEQPEVRRGETERTRFAPY